MGFIGSVYSMQWLDNMNMNLIKTFVCALPHFDTYMRVYNEYMYIRIIVACICVRARLRVLEDPPHAHTHARRCISRANWCALHCQLDDESRRRAQEELLARLAPRR